MLTVIQVIMFVLGKAIKIGYVDNKKVCDNMATNSSKYEVKFLLDDLQTYICNID